MYSCNKLQHYFIEEITELEEEIKQTHNYLKYFEVLNFYEYTQSIIKQINRKYLIQVNEVSDESITIIINRTNII